MSTRYIWNKRTFTSASLSASYTATPAHSGPHDTSGVSITIGESYAAELNEYGKPVLVPSGTRHIILDYDNDIKQWGTYRGSTYPYLIITGPGIESFCLKIPSSGYSWKVVLDENAWMWRQTVVDSSGNQQSENAEGRDLKYTYTASYATSASKSAYPNAAFVNAKKGYFEYKTSDSIDPTAISVTGTGSSRTITLTPSGTMQSLSGQVITYAYEVQVNGGSWTEIQSTSNKSITYSVPSSAYTVRFRAYAKDNFGFTSSTYVTSDVYTIKKCTVSVTASPQDGGNVTGGGSYDYGTSVTVRAAPNDGWLFSGWQVDGVTVSSSTSYTFKITGDKSFVALFTQKPVLSLSVRPAGGGTVTGGGEYTSGSYATAQAVPAEGFEFAGWEENGSIVSELLSYRFIITQSRTLTAVFKQKLRLWVGVAGKARKGTAMWVGVNGKARKVVGAWVGVNGKARRFL